ncbi:MAG: hypothetical protein QXZ17_04120 [Nitrososphaerota archaeon]
MAGVSLEDLRRFYGQLKDGELNQQKFRDFITQSKWTISHLKEWIEQARAAKLCFEFQDLIVAIGGKLGFRIEFGHYRSSKDVIALDGLWQTSDGLHIILEIKLGTWVMLDVAQLGQYVEKYVESKQLPPTKVCGLYVVGDIEEIKPLANQIRGSSYSNKIRVIYYKDLINLAELKEKTKISDAQVAKLLAPIDVIDVGELVGVVKDIVEEFGLVNQTPQTAERPIITPHDPSTITRKNLSTLPDGDVIICPSKANGVDFLKQYNAWGFIRISKKPRYFTLYVGRPYSELQFFAEVEAIVDAKDPSSPVKNPEDFETYEEGKKIIILKKDSLKKFADPLKLEAAFPPVSIRYTKLSKLLSAKSLDDLLEEE